MRSFGKIKEKPKKEAFGMQKGRRRKNPLFEEPASTEHPRGPSAPLSQIPPKTVQNSVIERAPRGQN